MRIATFNVQNLRLRTGDDGRRLDGARDYDLPEDQGPEAQALDPVDRRLTAAVIGRADADLVALQEVFNQETLDHFHDAVLVPSGVKPYPYRHCVPGNDGRGRDVALISRVPVDDVVSHAAATPSSLGLAPPEGFDATQRIFRRDCLEARIGPLTLFVCHFKAPYPTPAGSWAIRRLESDAVRCIIVQRFADPSGALWLVLGDLNDPADPDPSRGRATAPLRGDFSVDLVARLPEGERWSYRLPHSPRYSRPDALLASPALAARWPEARPRILRAGLERDTARHSGPRFAAVGDHRPHASDHAAIVIEFPSLIESPNTASTTG